MTDAFEVCIHNKNTLSDVRSAIVETPELGEALVDTCDDTTWSTLSSNEVERSNH